MTDRKAYKYMSVLFTIVAILILETAIGEYHITTINAILGMLVVFSIFIGGFIPGIISAVISMAYIRYINQVYYGAHSFGYSPEYVLINMSIYCIIVIAAVMAHRYRSYYMKYKEAHEYLLHATELSDVMSCLSTVDGTFIKVHPKLCSLLGYTQEELLSMCWRDITYPEDLEREEPLSYDLIRGNTAAYKTEKRLYAKDGKTIWVFCNVSAVKDNKGKIIYLLKYLVDISDRRKMEEENKHQLDFLNKLLDAIPNPIFIKNINSKTVRANTALSKYTGKDCDKLDYMDILTGVPEDEIDLIRQSCEKALTSNCVQEHRITTTGPNGEKRHAIIDIAPYTDINEKAAGIIGSITDITNIIKIKEQLRHSEEKYRSLVELDPDAIIIHKENVITFVNSAGINMLGAAQEELVGRNIYDFVHPDYSYNLKNHIGRALINLNHSGMPFEIMLTAKDGREIYIEAVNIAFANGNGVQVMAILRDITERKREEELKKVIAEKERRLEQARTYDKIKNEFFSNISHEFRTPLNVILGTLQLMELYRDSNKGLDNTDKYISLMKKNSYRLLRMVNNLIDITKIDEHCFNMRLGYHDIVSLVEDIILSVSDEECIVEKGLMLEFESDVEKKTIRCDSEQIKRILLNLISNAVKFTDTGGRIRTKISDKGSHITISVKDTGIGISEDLQPVIFDRFRQADKSFTRDNEGSGIGLSLVKALVELHGGTISLVSKPGCGSEFIIELPADSGTICHVGESAASESFYIDRTKMEFSDIYS